MNKNLQYSVFITLIYAILTLICVLYHETWTDEVQVWQLCKYLNPIQLISHLHNEGHPSFFYFLVMPFAKLFGNIIFMQLICWLASCLSVFLLLYFSPFKLITNLFIISGAGFIYFFPVIARSYSILPFLIFLAAILHTKRKEHMIIYSIVMVLLANTHIIMFGFVFIIMLLLITDILRNKFGKVKLSYFISAFIILLGLLFVILQLYDTGSSNSFIKPNFFNIVFHSKQVLSTFITESYSQYIFRTNLKLSFIDYSVILVMILNFIIIFVNLYLNSKKIFLIAFASIAFQLLVYVIAYPNIIYPTRIYSAYLIIVFCFWILIDSKSVQENKKICSTIAINIIVSIMFLLTVSNGIKSYILDININYSSAKQLAQYIENNINPDSSIILTEHEPFTLPVVYYLNNKYKLISLVRENDNELKYIKWDTDTITVLKPLSWLNGAYLYSKQYNNKDIYIIRNNINESDSYNSLFNEYFTLIFEADKSMLPYEKYMIYKFEKNKIDNIKIIK